MVVSTDVYKRQPVDREKTGDFKLLSDTAETINGEPANVYSMDLTNYFDELGFYPKLVRINYRCCWVPVSYTHL